MPPLGFLCVRGGWNAVVGLESTGEGIGRLESDLVGYLTHAERTRFQKLACLVHLDGQNRFAGAGVRRSSG